LPFVLQGFILRLLMGELLVQQACSMRSLGLSYPLTVIRQDEPVSGYLLYKSEETKKPPD
jgi:hypothetical protein